ncbi:MAG: hypothetical protein V1860_02570 [bacterium]
MTVDKKLEKFLEENPEYKGQWHKFIALNGGAASVFFKGLTEAEQLELRELISGGVLG